MEVAPRLTDKDRDTIGRLFQDFKRLLDEFGIDPANPKALGLFVLACAERRKPVQLSPGPGAPYRSAVEDEMILEFVGRELEEMCNSGLRPTIRGAAKRLAAWPYFLGISAETIRNRHGAILRRLRRGEPLPPKLQKRIDQLFASKVDAIHRQARARQDEE